MTRTALVLTLLLSACAAVASEVTPRERPWIRAPKGICITNVSVSADGLFVRFVTDLPPPYRVGVHVPQEVGLRRTFPVDYADVSRCEAFLPGRFLDENLFVQVYVPDDPAVCPAGLTRRMTAAERETYSHRANPRARVTRRIQDPTWYDDPADRDLKGIDPSAFEVCGDHVWGNFVYTTNTSLHFSIDLINRQKAGSTTYSYNTNTMSFAVSDRDPRVGTGFRLLLVGTEDPDTGEPAFACLAKAAYSMRTNMSQAVLLKRGSYCLSAHGGWRRAVDWEGVPVMVPCLDVAQDVVHTNGLDRKE